MQIAHKSAFGISNALRTASKTDHSHSCCGGDAKRARLEGSHGKVPGVLGDLSQAPKYFDMRFDDLTKNYGA